MALQLNSRLRLKCTFVKQNFEADVGAIQRRLCSSYIHILFSPAHSWQKQSNKLWGKVKLKKLTNRTNIIILFHDFCIYDAMHACSWRRILIMKLH